MSTLLDHLKNHVLLCDGGTGALVPGLNLSVEKDFLGYEFTPPISLRDRTWSAPIRLEPNL